MHKWIFFSFASSLFCLSSCSYLNWPSVIDVAEEVIEEELSQSQKKEEENGQASSIAR